jgi:hypothetical protein
MTIDFTKAVTAEAKAAAAQAALLTACQRAVDAHVEAAAKAKGYNSAAHMASYVASTVEAWADEATAFVAWRDAVWLATIDMLTQIKAGKMDPPDTPADVIARLPRPD